MKISIIGAGKVGVTLAFQLVMRGLASELVLHTRNLRRAQGDALDLDHAQAEIHAGPTPATRNSDLLLVCASASFDPTMPSRLALGPANMRMLAELLPPLLDLSPDAIVVMVSNPVDVLTWQALHITGLDPSRVFGTGTLLDSIRFRRALSRTTGIHPDDLRAYILGEHGETQFPAMSMAMAGAEPIEDTAAVRGTFQEVSRSGIEIFQMKGHTSYGIAAATTAIVESIVLDEKRTMPLSVLVDGFCGVSDVCLSLPVVVGRRGIQRVLRPSLNAAEADAFRHSAAVVRRAIDKSLAG